MSLLTGSIDAYSVLCTDSLTAYDTFAQNNNLKHVKVASGFFTNGVYNIQRANNYLLWHNFVNFAKETIAEKSTILSITLSILKTY